MNKTYTLKQIEQAMELLKSQEDQPKHFSFSQEEWSKEAISLMTNPEEKFLGFDLCLVDGDGEYHNIQTSLEKSLEYTRTVLGDNYDGWGLRYARILLDMAAILKAEAEAEVEAGGWSEDDLANAYAICK